MRVSRIVARAKPGFSLGDAGWKRGSWRVCGSSVSNRSEETKEQKNVFCFYGVVFRCLELWLKRASFISCSNKENVRVAAARRLLLLAAHLLPFFFFVVSLDRPNLTAYHPAAMRRERASPVLWRCAIVGRGRSACRKAHGHFACSALWLLPKIQ